MKTLAYRNESFAIKVDDHESVVGVEVATEEQHDAAEGPKHIAFRRARKPIADHVKRPLKFPVLLDVPAARFMERVQERPLSTVWTMGGVLRDDTGWIHVKMRSRNRLLDDKLSFMQRIVLHKRQLETMSDRTFERQH